MSNFSETAEMAPGGGPFFKWAGGKRQILDALLKRAPSHCETYFEPFLGGGALFFALASSGRFRSAILSDSNLELITAFRVVRGNLPALLERLLTHQTLHSEKHFYAMRALMPLDLPEVDRAARFLYLNRAGYNGLYRLNASGDFNVPFGKRKEVRFDEERLRSASLLLQRAEIWAEDFCNVRNEARPSDFVYFDPPYLPLSNTSNFTSYTAGGFKPRDQLRLALLFHELSDTGVPALLSNSDTEFCRVSYAQFLIEEVQAARAINSKGTGRGKISELLISNSALVATRSHKDCR